MRCDAMRCDAMRCDAMRCDAMRCDALIRVHCQWVNNTLFPTASMRARASGLVELPFTGLGEGRRRVRLGRGGQKGSVELFAKKKTHEKNIWLPHHSGPTERLHGGDWEAWVRWGGGWNKRGSLGSSPRTPLEGRWGSGKGDSFGPLSPTLRNEIKRTTRGTAGESAGVRLPDGVHQWQTGRTSTALGGRVGTRRKPLSAGVGAMPALPMTPALPLPLRDTDACARPLPSGTEQKCKAKVKEQSSSETCHRRLSL